MTEPTDDECQAIAMLTEYRFNANARYDGRKILYKAGRSEEGKLVVVFVDPVTMKVMGKMPAYQFYNTCIEGEHR